MKSLVLIAALAFAGIAHAEQGIEDTIAAGGVRTVIGGCADAVQTGGEDSTIVYTGPCNAQVGGQVYVSDYSRVSRTFEAAQAHCAHPDYVQPSYTLKNWKLKLKGYVCAPVPRGESN